jgi:hypothetical protein
MEVDGGEVFINTLSPVDAANIARRQALKEVDKAIEALLGTDGVHVKKDYVRVALLTESFGKGVRSRTFIACNGKYTDSEETGDTPTAAILSAALDGGGAE